MKRTLALALMLLCTNAFASMKFTGANSAEKISVASGLPNLTNSWTLAVWIKSTAVINSQGHFFARENNAASDVQLDFGVLNTQKVYFWKGAAFVLQSTTLISDTNWHQLTLTRSGNVWTLYIDGTQDTQVTDAFVQSTTAYTLVIDCGPAGTQNFLGDIAEPAIWTTPLSAGEAKALFKGTPPNRIERTSLQFYLPMYVSTGNTGSTPDYSGGQWNGTINTNTGTVTTDNHCPCSSPAGTEP